MTGQKIEILNERQSERALGALGSVLEIKLCVYA